MLLQQRMELDDKIAADVARIEAKYQSNRIDLERLEIRPRKSDISVEPVMIVWTPWFVDNSDIGTALFSASLTPEDGKLSGASRLSDRDT